jgi:hypothetical protein
LRVGLRSLLASEGFAKIQPVATPPPIKSSLEDVDALAAYLKTQAGWVAIDAMKKAIPTRHADNRKIEAVRYIGLLDRDGTNVKLTGDGRDYANGDAATRSTVLRKRLRTTPLYRDTLTWLHFNNKESVTKADVGSYWHEKHEDLLAGAAGAALTDAAVFFMRLVDAAGLGKFVAAGVGRVTHLEVDRPTLNEFVTGEVVPEELPEPEKETPPPPPPPPAPLKVDTGLKVNVEIHIAADAKAATIEEIFKNMRKYLLDQPDTSANGG